MWRDSRTRSSEVMMDAQTKGIKTGCFREFQNSIDDSVHSLLCDEIDRLELSGFEKQNAKLNYKGQEVFKFKGLARNPESIKSMHGFERFWVEEAQTISYKSLKALTPTLRSDDSEIWMTANPQSSADPFSQRFIKPFEKELNKHGYYEDDLHLIININHSDNPLFPNHRFFSIHWSCFDLGSCLDLGLCFYQPMCLNKWLYSNNQDIIHLFSISFPVIHTIFKYFMLKA